MFLINLNAEIVACMLSFRKGEFRDWTRTNGTLVSREEFRKIRKLSNFRKVNNSTENSGNSGMKIQWNGNLQESMFENLGIPHEVVLFFGNYANLRFPQDSELVLLAAITASCTSHARTTATLFRKWKYL